MKSVSTKLLSYPATKLNRFLAPKPHRKAYHRNRGMEVVVLHVCVEEADDVATHDKPEDRNDAVHETEDDQEETGVAVRSRGDETDDARCDMYDVMRRIDLEDEQCSVDEESGDADEEQHDAEDFRDQFDKRGHGKGGKKKIFPSIVRFWCIVQELDVAMAINCDVFVKWLNG